MPRLGERIRSRTGGRRPSSRVRDSDYFPFVGGLNTEDPPLQIKPGELLGCKNYEPGVRGGYRRVDGFERFDGRGAASDANYLLVPFDAGSPADYPSDGDTVTGGTSGATGTVKAVIQYDAFNFGFGAGFGGPIDQGYLILIDYTGTFQDDEDLIESATTFASVNGSPEVNGEPDNALDELYRQYAADSFRATIQAVPGSGPIRGVWLHLDTVYAFRDNAGATACVMHKSTGSGWSEVSLGTKLRFNTGGTAEISEGDVLDGATSGATGTVARIGTTGGDWSTSNKTGYVILTGVTGTFQDGEDLTISATKVAEADGVSFTQTLTAGGRYEFRSNNFYGQSDKYRMYGVNGLDPCFEYDAAEGVFCQIDTGMDNDAPTHLCAHLDFLGLMFPGGVFQLSGQHRPIEWEVVVGAAVWALGDECTGLLEEIGASDTSALFAFTRNKTYRLTGLSKASFQFVTFSPNTGSAEWTIQRIGLGVYLDDRGFVSLRSSQRYGNFQDGVITDKLRSEVRSLMKQSAIDSHVVRGRNLYRCSFSNGKNLVIGFSDNKPIGATVTDYDMPVRCSCSREDSTGLERTFFGSDDGYIYEIKDSLRDFDGEDIEHFIRLAFHFSRSPSRHKRYRLATIDITSEGRTTTLQANVDYSYGDPDTNFQPPTEIDAPGGGGFWDIDEWGTFQWDSSVNQTGSFKLEGSGTNLSMGFYGNTRNELPHTLSGANLHYSMRRLNRSTNVS